MSSVYFPAQVVILFRRVVNVISTVSISNQYILYKNASAGNRDVTLLRPHAPLTGASLQSHSHYSAWRILETLRSLEWMHTRDSRSRARDALNEQHVLKASLTLPWFGRRWSWPSLMSVSAGGQTEASGPPDTPPPRSNPRPPHQKHTHRKHASTDAEPEHELKRKTDDTIHQLMRNPALFDPLRTPRYPIVLCHGLYGFDVRGPASFPALRMHYWSNVLSILRGKVGAEVIVTTVPGTGSIASRSESMDRQLQNKVRGRGINFLAHSMGGLDCRHLISHIKPSEYTPLSLTSVSTPHRGSPFMDWCAANIGIGKVTQREQLLSKSTPSSVASAAAAADPEAKSDASFSLAALPASFTTLLLSIVDSPAYANLTSTYLNTVFNPATPDDPRVRYFSVAGRMPAVNVWHPFWLPKMVLDAAEERERSALRADGAKRWAHEDEWGNDGLVPVQSAKWGEFLGIMDGADHWEMRGARGIQLADRPLVGGARGESGDGWGLRDWARFVGAWKKEEKTQRDATVAAAAAAAADERGGREKKREREEEAVKSSTDRLSAVFDWLVEQVPAPPLLGVKGKMLADAENATRGEVAALKGEKEKGEPSEMKQHMERVGNTSERRRNELASKLDLEKFYVALSRKLYDEGL